MALRDRTIHSYLSPVTTLDDNSQHVLKALLRVTVEVRCSTSQIERILGGSPQSGSLGSALSLLQLQVDSISESLRKVFTTYASFPGMYLVRTQFAAFKSVLFNNFNDESKSMQSDEGVCLLEKLIYVTGMLRGHLEMVLEQHSYWKAKLAGEQPPYLVRKLDFNQKIDPASTRESGLRLEVSVCLPEEVQAMLASLWENQRYTDITFLINGYPVSAHKAILASQSEYFERMLFGEMREASKDEITLQDVPLVAFYKVLDYVYSGTLHMKECTLQVILEVVAVANRFSFVALKEALGDQLSRHISLNTVIPLLVHSDIYHLPELHKKCLSFIESLYNTRNVLQSPSFLDLPEECLIEIISRDSLMVPELAIFQAVVRWKEHNERSVEELARVLEHIRLSELSPQEIFDDVEPMKLFSQESLLTALRLRYRPSITDIHPRGRKEPNQNLFTMRNVAFDSLHHFIRPPCSRAMSRSQCVADTIIQLGFPSSPRRGLLSTWKNTCGSVQLVGCTITIALHDSYIINYLHLKGYPGVSEEEQVSKSFSYTVKLSQDKSNWLELFDYSSFACRGAQHLPFPKQAARYIRVDLTGKQDATQPTSLQLSACCYVENQKPFKFLPKGVIAPQYEQEVVTIPSTVTTDSTRVCVAYFSQPYSASLIKFHLKCSDPSVVEVDITVSVGVSSNLEEREALQDMERTPLQSQVIVETQERVVGYVAVAIRKLHKKMPTPKPHILKYGKFRPATEISTALQELEVTKEMTSHSSLGEIKPAPEVKGSGLQLSQLSPTEKESGSGGGGGGGGGGSGLSTGGGLTTTLPTTSNGAVSSAGQLSPSPVQSTFGSSTLKQPTPPVPVSTTSQQPALGRLVSRSQQPVPVVPASTKSQESALTGPVSTSQQPTPAEATFKESTQPQPVPSTAQAVQAVPQIHAHLNLATTEVTVDPPTAAVSSSTAVTAPDRPEFTIVDVLCRAAL